MADDRQDQPRRSWAVRALRWCILIVAITAVLWVTGCMERLFYYPQAGPTPLPAEFPRAEAVDFFSADGTPLHGWFIPADVWGGPGSSQAPPATILHVHGNAGDISNHLWFSEFLPAAGFNLFLFDYRGYGQSAGRAVRRNDLIADTEAALDVLMARPDVDRERIGLFGQSLGGSIGLNVMAERPEIRCAVILSAFSSWRDMGADGVSGGNPGFVSRTLAAILIKDHRRPDEAITRIDRPILIIHGDADQIVPVRHGRVLADAAPDARLIEVPGGDHNGLRAVEPRVDRDTIGFFREHLTGDVSDMKASGAGPES